MSLPEIQNPSIPKPVPDEALPSLQEFIQAGNTRRVIQSRYDFARNPHENTVSIRFDRELSEADANIRKQTCSAMLILALNIAQESAKPLSNSELLSFYDMATVRLGLSRLETEELAPHSIQWLEFCIRPHPAPTLQTSGQNPVGKH